MAQDLRPTTFSQKTSPTQTKLTSDEILDSTPWKINHLQLPARERARLSYDRAKAVGLHYDISVNDISSLSQKFWDMHTNPINCLDGAATTLLTIQYNLSAGTIIHLSQDRNDLDLLIDDLLKFRTIGQFMLTEVGHGLDVDNIETTATLVEGGDFILSTPTTSAAKYMPPTIPVGTPTIAVVFARLVVAGKDCGVRPFVVPLNDGKQMCAGVTAKLLPYRELSCPVNHAITTFDNVRLPSSSLLGNLDDFSADYSHFEFLQSIWRIAVGGIALASIAVPTLKIHTFIGAMYSMRRTSGIGKTRVPLLHFRTQQLPVLTAISASYVLEAFQKWATKQFSDAEQDFRIRHGIATCFKAVAVQQAQLAAISLSERCGAQGLQVYNMMTNMFAEMRGIAIAEGDILVLSIRLAMEILLERYALPQTDDASSLLAQHEAGLISRYRSIIKKAPHHRSSEVNKLVLPHCQRIVEAIGHRMAYDAAISEGVSQNLVDLYVSSILKYDQAWYVENMGLNLSAQEEFQAKALDNVLPQVDELVQGLGVRKYVSAPIVDNNSWDSFVKSLEFFQGTGRMQVLPRARL